MSADVQQDEILVRKRLGRAIGIAVCSGAGVSLLLALWATNLHPRTDDASVRANLIGIVPEVNGRLVQLPIKDNAYIRKDELLFEIDPRPYQYALEQALSDQAQLEQQIIDEKRKIAAQHSAVEAARAGFQQSATSVSTAGSSVDLARAAVLRAQASVTAAQAQLKLATNDLNRIEPLLPKQYVTVQQVDQTRTGVRVAQGNFDEAQAALVEAQAQETEAIFRQKEAASTTVESQAKVDQAMHTVERIETLKAALAAKAAKVSSARLDLERCRVVAPFDAYVTNLNIAVGAYAHPGAPLFTLIDTQKWYVIANYREAKLKHIRIGSPVDVYLMGHPDRRFAGTVESVGFGVLPEDGAVAEGLPDIERTLNWVHLSSRFPVRIRIQNPDPTVFRIGATAVTVVR
jgi:multidrug efflux system membrane fusion protein